MNEPLPVIVPRIARPKSRARVAPYAVALVAIGTGVFAGLSSTRTTREEQANALPTLAQAPTTVAAPAALPAAQPAPPTPAPIPMTSPPSPAAAPTPTEKSASIVVQPAPAAPPVDTKTEKKDRLNSPALIIDLGPGPESPGRDGRLPLLRASFSDASFGDAFFSDASFGDQATAPAPLPAPATPIPTVAVPDPTGAAIAAAGPAADASVAAADAATRDLNGNERFAQRAGNRETEVVQAQRLPNQQFLVVQGTLIAGVMETALNSDLPGYARAIVTRDVLSFDGSQVLIPAGSRVIGEYNSGVAQGASRIFIIWNRLIRPDGVSVALGSPAVDNLGRGGLAGKVNRHFLLRFGGAILLSVLGTGTNLLASRSRNSTVIVSNSSEANSLAGAVGRPGDIAPTITTPQGAAVQIFVARDLDFTGVGPAV